MWIGLAIAITFGVKFFFMLPNNREGFWISNNITHNI
jgi:hypothetical protein